MSVLVERKSDSQGYVEETSVDGITVRSQGNDKDAQCKIGADNFKVTLPYALSDGDSLAMWLAQSLIRIWLRFPNLIA